MSQQDPPPFDVARAHRHFSAACFNHAWTLIEKPDRTPGDVEAMILAASASLWHWTQRPGHTNQHLSIGHWQLARVYALAGQGENAMRHARRSLALAEGCPPFYVGYAHEAIARAAEVLGDHATRQTHAALAAKCAGDVVDPGERSALDQDLCTIGGFNGPESR